MPAFASCSTARRSSLEDYLEIRPERRAELEDGLRAGRIAIGPWYVQPDSLLPSGEAHVRNLLEGRRVGSGVGPVSTVAYTPDSFGHPAQFPQLFAGFGLAAVRLLARQRQRDRHAARGVRVGGARRQRGARAPPRRGLLRRLRPADGRRRGRATFLAGAGARARRADAQRLRCC